MTMDPNEWFRESLRQKETKADDQHKRNSDDINDIKAELLLLHREINEARDSCRREMQLEYVRASAFTDALKLIEERYKWFVWLTRAMIVGGLFGIGAKLMALVGLGK